jgi:hypothetical protein
MRGAKKFISKSKFRGNRYVVLNKTAGVSERRQPQSDKSGKSYEKHNLSRSNKKIHGTSMNTEINVGENKFCNGESDFTQEWNIVVS